MTVPHLGSPGSPGSTVQTCPGVKKNKVCIHTFVYIFFSAAETSRAVRARPGTKPNPELPRALAENQASQHNRDPPGLRTMLIGNLARRPASAQGCDTPEGDAGRERFCQCLV